jgi:hypothetical protein
MTDFDTQYYDDLESLPDLEQKMTRYSKIIFDLSLPDQIHRHGHTYEHYRKQLIALVYQYTKIKGKDRLTKKLETMLDKIEKLRELESK